MVRTQAELLTEIRRGLILADRKGWWYGEGGMPYEPRRGARLAAHGWVRVGAPDHDGDAWVTLTTQGRKALAEWEAVHGPV
jgi:hypothetical protein